MVGAAVDYQRAAQIRTALKQVADSSALMAAQSASQRKLAGDADWKDASQRFGVNAFYGGVRGVGLTAYVKDQPRIDITEVNGTYSANVLFYGYVPTSLMKIAGFDVLNVGGTVTAQVKATQALYSDLHIVVDVSGSMGLGADASDQSLMKSVIGCEFGCHAESGDARARNAGAMLRLDVVKNALITELKKVRFSDHLRIAIHTISNKLTTVAPLTTSVDSALSALSAVDLTGEDGQAGTNISASLQQLEQQLIQTGAGATQSTSRRRGDFRDGRRAGLDRLSYECAQLALRSRVHRGRLQQKGQVLRDG